MTTQHDILLQELYESIQKIRSLQSAFDTARFDITQCQYELEKLRQSNDPNADSGSKVKKSIEQRYQERNVYSCKILQDLVTSFNAGMEKTKLVFDLLKHDLDNWKVSQKIAQIGPRMEGAGCYLELDKVDQRFEELDKQLCDLVVVCESWIERLEQNTNERGTSELVAQLKVVKTTLTNQIMAAITAESLVIARQPPMFMIPGREKASTADQHRGVRHPCSPMLRILGGECLGFRTQQLEVTCRVISEAEARKLMTTPRYQPDEVGTLRRNCANFEKMPSGSFQASFKNIQLVRFKRENDSSTPATRRRYYLVFDVQLVGRYFRLSKSILSLPFGIYVNIVQRFDQGGDAFIWWQLAFCKGNGVLSESAPHAIPWQHAIEALDKKFQQLIEEPDKPYDVNNPPEPPRGLNDVARNHLTEKLNQNGFLNWEDFWMKKICVKYDAKRGREVPATFREWFYVAGQTINSVLRDYWNKGLITAFADKDTAKALVAQDPQQSKMLIRFSDGRIGHIMFTHHLPQMGQDSEHMALEVKLLENMTLDLADVVRRDPTLKHINFIYPNYPISLLSKDVPVPQEQPRQDRQRRWGYEVKEMQAGIAYTPASVSEPIEEEEIEEVVSPQNNIDPFLPDQWFGGQEELMQDDFFDYNFDPTAALGLDQLLMQGSQPEYERTNLDTELFRFTG